MSCEAMGLSITDQPEGLALLIATRKIQSAYRAKTARKRMRERRALQQDGDGDSGSRLGVDQGLRRLDGYPYRYHQR